MAWSKVVASRGQESGRALIVARLIVGVRGTAASGVEFLGTLMAVAWCKGFLVWPGQRWWYSRHSGSGVGAGMSGVKLVGALGRDQTYVSAGNPTHRKGNGRRGNVRDTAVGRVGVEAAGTAPKGQGKTQRDLILEAVEALKTLLGQGVGTQVVDLTQEHFPSPPQVTPPGSPSELERAQHLARL